MTTMDLQGVTWVGNLYDKFESMCLEVEENMYQDTVKYMENQVQTVGASVKKFYSDVMQDLGHTSAEPMKGHALAANTKLAYSDVAQASFVIDPVTTKAHDSTWVRQNDIVVHKTPKSGLKEEFTHPDIVRSNQVSNKLDHVTEDSTDPLCLFSACHPLPLSSGECVMGKCSEMKTRKDIDAAMHTSTTVRMEETCSEECVMGECSEMKTRKGRGTATRTSTKVLMEENCYSGRLAPSETSTLINPLLTELRATSNQENTVSQTEIFLLFSGAEGRTCSSGNAQKDTCDNQNGLLGTDNGQGAGMTVSVNDDSVDNIDGTCMDDTVVSMLLPSEDACQSDESAEEIMISRPERSMAQNSELIDLGLEKVELLEGFEVEEACVLVDASNSSFVSQKDGKHMSYKKRIREAILRRKKSGRKQEYEQLALQYGEIGIGSSQQSPGSTARFIIDTGREKFADQDLCESGWEVL